VVEGESEVDTLRRKFPSIDLDDVRRILVACEGNVKVAEEELARFEKEAEKTESKLYLMGKYSDVDEETITDVLAACNYEVDAAARALEIISQHEEPREPTPPPQQEEDTELPLGSAYAAAEGSDPRRVLVFLDDSGSMAGKNSGTARSLLAQLVGSLDKVPTKVVLFGSKNKVRLLSEWTDTSDWHAIGESIQGQGGRTFLWECIVEYAGIEDSTGLHIFLVTDGEDTESSGVLQGADGMVPAVQSLNAMSFKGEISLVALGNEISTDLGQRYMSLVGATGGAGCILNEQSQDTIDGFAKAFSETVAIRGEQAQEQREERVEEYLGDR